MFDPGGVQIDHEEMLGVTVDFLTPGDLPLAIRARVLAEAKPI